MRAQPVVAALILVGAVATARGNTYTVPPDFRVVALDRVTGKELWRATPGPLSASSLHMVNGTLIVEELASHRRFAFDPATGTRITDPPTGDATIEQLAPLGGSLVDDQHRTFLYSPGNTHDLVARAPGADADATVTVLALESYVHDLNIVGHFAIFNFADEAGSGAGEAYAWDLQRGALAWEHDAAKLIHDRPLDETGYTGIAADATSVFVSVDQSLFALDVATGKVQWMTALTRQTLCAWDSPWTTIARDRDALFVQVYDALFVLDAKDGRLRWSFPAGPFAQPWPLVERDRVYLVTRDAAATQRSGSSLSGRERRPSAVKIVTQGGQYALLPIARRDIPPSATVWWSLKHPPSSKTKSHVSLRLHFAATTHDLDLSAPLSQQPIAYVKFSHALTTAELLVDGRVVGAITR